MPNKAQKNQGIDCLFLQYASTESFDVNHHRVETFPDECIGQDPVLMSGQVDPQLNRISSCCVDASNPASTWPRRRHTRHLIPEDHDLIVA